ncbi:glycosyltransferase [Desemzia sp. FAM 24101]|uniref:glycosyltransferase n=1 Tax=Desemzia sp. FAM 24101 TaxID=3259522 RepID=UPI00388718AC
MMKITHICLCGPVTDNLTYQDNLLPKYHKLLGYEVSVIASKYIWNDNGKIDIDERNVYFNEYGIKTLRISNKKHTDINSKLKRYENVYETLKTEKPDILFIHGVQFLDISNIVDYLKDYPQVEVFVDNHADFSNSATNRLSKNILHKGLWRHLAQKINPYVSKFYGVLPARVDFLHDVYKIPKEKIELLVMGADDEMIIKSLVPKNRKNLRQKLGIKEDEFLIVTGGKIDNAKKQVLLLMKAIKKLKNKKVKLIVYGSVIDNLMDEVQKLSEDDSIDYIGWIDNAQSYNLFSAADLLVFPGRHSVYWEQAVAMGKPLVVKYWEGTTHIDIGGNCIFLYKNTEEEIFTTIKKIINEPKLYNKLLISALSNKKNDFLYSEIAKKSIKENQ